jgi:protein TonB
MDVTEESTPGTEQKFYLSRDNEIFGPHSAEEIQELLDSNVIGPESLIWTEGMEEWLPLEQLSGPTAGEEIPDEESPVEEQPEEADEPGFPPDPITATEEPAVEEAAAPDEPAEDSSPSDVAPAQKPFRVADTFEPEQTVAQPYHDGLGRRLAIGLGLAAILHLCLLAWLVWKAPTMFHIISYPAPQTPPEAPPLEVAFVSPEDAAPPPETPRPIEETPPPPVAPPPPPAIPEVPLQTPPPTSQPAAFAPPTVPQPMMEAPPVPTPAAPRPQPVHVTPHMRSTAPPAPSVPTMANAGPSDYLYRPDPPYPYLAKHQHQEGTVILLVRINDAGDPIDVQVHRSSGYTILDESARSWVAENYRFKPGDLRLLLVPVTYQLR